MDNVIFELNFKSIGIQKRFESNQAPNKNNFYRRNFMNLKHRELIS